MVDRNVRAPLSIMNPTPEDLTANAFLNPYAPIQRHSHRLPHWQQGPVHYFVTWRLADSLPKDKLGAWIEEKSLWHRNHPPPWSPQIESDYRKRFVKTIDDWLDVGEGSCLLGIPSTSEIVAKALLHWDGGRYVIDSFVVMPNHVHVLFRLIAPNRLELVIKSWKGFTARQINRQLKCRGRLWQGDYWDRMIRDEGHLLRCREYIQANPSKAHLSKDRYLLFVRKLEGGFSYPPPQGGQECPPS